MRMTTEAENSCFATERRYPRAAGRGARLGRGLGGERASGQRQGAPRPVHGGRSAAVARPGTHGGLFDAPRTSRDSSIRPAEGDPCGTRIVAVDGSRPSIGQSIVRLLALPLAALRMRAAHDELAATEVVAD